jgi:protein-S-isoprenylcysteine O-methyltransferase Ste14
LAGLAYGLAAVAVMWAFWVAFVLFLANAPRLRAPWLDPSVDVGSAFTPPLAALVDLALIALFGLQHSLMARPKLKARWASALPPALVRATYVHAANAALIVLILLWQPIPIVLWHVDQPLLRDALWVLFALGWITLLWGAISFGLGELLGLSQVWAWFRGRPPPPLRLKTGGLYRWLRHPMYVGVLVGVWATPHMTIGHALLAGGLTLYVLIARRYEERDLGAAFGPAYRRWRTS